MLSTAVKSDGDLWEQRALLFLEQQGLQLITRNFRARTGELDLVMTDRTHVVFIEVRKRQVSRFSSAAASIDARKMARLRRTAMLLLQQYPQLASKPCRFDVLAFDAPSDSMASAAPRWLRGVDNGF